MSELIDRIGALTFLQVAIEGWNEIFLLILISIMLIGVRRDKADELVRKVKIPLTNELILFFTATFVYNFCNIIDLCFGGMPTFVSYWCIRIGVFGYYASGEFQTLLFLRVIKKYISEKSGNLLKKTVFAFELLQIPNILLLLLTPFTNALYYIDTNNDYNRSWGYWIWQAVTILTFVFIGVVIIAKWKNISNYLKHIIITATIFPMIALVASPFMPDVSLNNIMVAVTALILFITYEDEHNIYIKVTDNATAEQGDDTLFAESRGIGLNNARERLQMLCGGDISVTHNENDTSVVVTIPKTEQEET